MMIKIPVLAGAYHDLSVFDFSFQNISIVNIKDDAVDDYIRRLSPDLYENNIRFITQIRETIHFDHERKFVVLSNNLESFDYKKILNCWKILLIIFPSDLQIEHIIHYENSMGFYQSIMMETHEKRQTGDYPGKLLMYSNDYLQAINEFIRLVFDRLDQNNYIGIAIENYIQSYTASHFHYQFLTLLFALESVVEQEQELSYRLKRFVSVLCGEAPFNCNIIFQNLSELYKIRSKVVHGGNIQNIYEDLLKNIEVLQALVSQTIIELLIHNLTNISMLNKRLTVLGYGEKGKLTDNHQNFMLNINTYTQVNWHSIKQIEHNDPFVKWLSTDD